MATNLNDYMSPKQAAEYIGISTQLLRYWIKKNKMAFHINGITGTTMYKRKDIEEIKENYEPRSRKNKDQ